MSLSDLPFNSDQFAFLVRQRVARLATSDGSGEPHVVPVCFACNSLSHATNPGSVYIALDEKPKEVTPTRLKRVRNILENPRVALVADRYAEDWSLLAYLLVRGPAEILDVGGKEHGTAVNLLRGKYHQYEGMAIEENPVVAIRPQRVTGWGALSVVEIGEKRLPQEIRGRRSVRHYLPKEVSEELVEEVLEIGRWAPSPHGRQPWRFAVLRRPESKERLAEAMGEQWRTNLEMDGQEPEVVQARLEGSRRRITDAPVLILVCLYLEELDRYLDQNRGQSETIMAIQSLGAAAQNMLLAAHSSGLDGGWMCAPLFCPEAVVEALGLDPALIPHALLTLGYAAADPRRRSRKGLDELVIYLD